MAKYTRGFGRWATPPIDKAAASAPEEGVTMYTVRYTFNNPRLAPEYPDHKAHARGVLTNEWNRKEWSNRRSAERWIAKHGSSLTRGTLEVIEV